MRTLQRAALYFRTVRYLRLQQIAGRIVFRLRRPAPDLRQAPACRAPIKPWTTAVLRRVSLLSETRWRFLNEEHEVVTKDDWNAPALAKLWLYNLHYFDDLNAHDAAVRHGWHVSQLQRWIAENPPGTGVGWEPYPISLRVVNLVKWFLCGNEANAMVMHSLAVQARFLMKRLEYHLLGNHLFANAKALIFAGLFFSGDEAERWCATGLRIIEEQLDEQILADGGHFERSPMYHALMLEDALDLLNLCTVYGRPVGARWESIIKKMLGWLAVMTHPDGELAFFNDAAMGVAPRLQSLLEYAGRLGIEHTWLAAPQSNLLADSGYARIERDGMVLLADIGPIGPDYLPGHAHADTLSFELSLGGRRVVVNCGTSVYGTGDERQRQRGTAAHNTVRVDQVDSSEVWAGFRVARRARVRDVRRDEASVAGTHDGYARLPGKPLHRRYWTAVEGGLDVVDEISVAGRHLAEIFFHFHPDWRVQLGEEHVCRVWNSKATSSLVIHLDPGLAWCIGSSSWHPEFGIAMPSYQLVGEWCGELPTRSITRIRWSCES